MVLLLKELTVAILVLRVGFRGMSWECMISLISFHLVTFSNAQSVSIFGLLKMNEAGTILPAAGQLRMRPQHLSARVHF